MSKTFFTSDTHFFHENIIGFCNRPFVSVDHMNHSLINNWNSVVGVEDHVWFLGDFSFGKDEETQWVLSQLKGIKHLIVGNHDRKGRPQKTFNKEWGKWFVDRNDYYRLNVDGHKFVLCHFPFKSWERGYINLHGHLHNTPETYKPVYRQYEVGCDLNNYTPIVLADVVKKANLAPKPIDHY